jgi:hypothetical protein
MMATVKVTLVIMMMMMTASTTGTIYAQGIHQKRIGFLLRPMTMTATVARIQQLKTQTMIMTEFLMCLMIVHRVTLVGFQTHQPIMTAMVVKMHSKTMTMTTMA